MIHAPASRAVVGSPLESVAATISSSRSRQPVRRDVRAPPAAPWCEPGTPRANAISERWVKSVRTAYLDHLFIFSAGHFRRTIPSYVKYFNCWRPHESLGQGAPVIRQSFRVEIGSPTARLSLSR